jgi:hypothetical protein
VEEDAGAARLFGSRGVEESGLFVFDRVHHTFCFSPPKRGRKLSNEDQVKMKRSKSPERKDEQQAEQAETPAWTYVWSRGVLRRGVWRRFPHKCSCLGDFYLRKTSSHVR